MKTLEVTDEQYAVIQHLREAISEEVVGKYGFVRERDAIQFLIDNLDGEDELEIELETDVDFSATDDVAASVGAAIEGKSTPEDLEEVSYIEDGPDEGADEDGADDVTDDDVDETIDSDGDDADADDGADADESDSEADDADSDEDGSESDSGENASEGGSADDDDMLDEMMSLLETHDDKWEESSSADFRYSVELPDGTTEDVQTKDDVRATLFKNYR